MPPVRNHWRRDRRVSDNRGLAAADAGAVVPAFVDDGDVLTAGGVTSGSGFALHLVERECGADAAECVAEEIEYERRSDPAET